MDEKKTSVLVTGGAGFIGSHLIDALLLKGYRTIAVDNLLTGSRDNLKEAFKNPNLLFVEHDVSKPFNNATIQQFGNIDFIFHLASPASVIDYQTYPEETALVNSVGTIHLLELAKNTKARFLFASTSEVYGDPKENPQNETYWGHVNPNGIRSCYDESKRFGEAITMVYVRKYRIDARVVRIFNTYGPRMRKTDGRVISNFVNQALERKPITVYGDGNQTRSFCYVSDLVEGILRLMFTEKAKGEVVNIGNPEEYRVIDLAEKIKAMTASESDITFSKLPEDDPKERRPDISKAGELLDWEPVISVDAGLTKTIEYYKSLS